MKLWAIVPELIIAGMCLGLVPLAAWVRGGWRRAPGIVALAGLGASVFFTVRMLPWAPVSVFEGTYAVDGLAHVLKLIIEVSAWITVLLVMSYFEGRWQSAHAPVAVLFATLGAIGLVSSMDLGLILLFLEMTGLASYILAALVRESDRALEAALKYFIYGAVTLSVTAYGLTFLYGLTGSLNLDAIGTEMARLDAVWVSVAFLLILAGFGFEIMMVPFHMWGPDVLEGATSPISGFVSVVPKIGALGVLLRVLLYALDGEAVGWPWWIAILAAISMTWGNLAALGQTRLKRLLAYSAIAQGGYILMAVVVAARVDGALVAVAFYLAAYAFMNIGAFAVAAQVERTFGTDSFDAIEGMGWRMPGAAVVLTLSLLSLAGIPPLAGFAGKILLFEAAMSGGWTGLAVIAAANITVGLFYYVRVVAVMYLRMPALGPASPSARGFATAYAICLAGTLLIGILPGWNARVMAFAGRLLER